MISKFIILSFLLTTAYAGPHINSNSSTQFNTRVSSGEDAQPGEFPYQVFLQRGNSWDSIDHFCGGSIIAKDWILTAAHCLRMAMEGFSILVVKAGKIHKFKTDNTEQMREVEQRYVYPDYSGYTQLHDVALLKLKTPLELNAYVSIIELPTAGVEPPTGQATVTGWGSISKTEEYISPEILQKGQLPIVDRSTCSKSLKALEKGWDLSDTDICTLATESGVDSCRGDSGGPLVIETQYGKQIVGIVSWGPVPCGHGPSVYAKVSAYITWISSVQETAA